MPNPFYNVTNNPIGRTLGRSDVMRAEFALVEDGFDATKAELDLKAPLNAPTFTGLATFTGSVDASSVSSFLVPTVSPVSDATNKAASTAFVIAAIGASGTMLPPQVTHDGKSLRTDGVSAFWSASVLGYVPVGGSIFFQPPITANLYADPSGAAWIRNGVVVSYTSDLDSNGLTLTQKSPFTQRVSGASSSLARAQFIGGRFFALSGSGFAPITSTDGVTWSATSGANGISQIIYSGSLFIGVPTGGNQVARSSDGVTWTLSAGIASLATPGSSGTFAAGAFGFLAGFEVISSGDGVTWSRVNPSAGNALWGLSAIAGTWVTSAFLTSINAPGGVAGNYILRSTTGAAGTYSAIASGNFLISSIANDGASTFVATGTNGVTYVSTNSGATWATVTHGIPGVTGNGFVTWTGSAFLLRYSNGIARSTNGTTWTVLSEPALSASDWSNFGGGVVGHFRSSGLFSVSFDHGLTWPSQIGSLIGVDSNAALALFSSAGIANDGVRFVACGGVGVVATAPHSLAPSVIASMGSAASQGGGILYTRYK